MQKPILFLGVLFLGVSSATSALAVPCVPSGAGAADYVRCREDVEARRKQADALLREARDMAPKEAAPKQREAAQMLLDAWSDGFAAACRAGERKWCEHSGELLFQAAHAFRSGGEKARARDVRGMLLDPKNGVADEPIAARALFDSGVDAWLQLDFENAAKAFEYFAARQPKDESAGDALENAFVYRVALGDLDKAEKALDTLSRAHAARALSSIEFLAFGLADAYGRAEDWPRVERFLAAREALFAKADDELRLRVDALKGRALSKQGKLALAEAAYKRVASFPIERLQQRAKNAIGGERALGRALEAIGEATLFRADTAGAEYLQLAVKRGDKASLKKKEEALARAEKAYLAVLQLEPVPPPRQTVAAGARVARLYGQLWAQVHTAFGDVVGEPYLARAKAAHKTCVDYAAKFQVADPGAANCSAWLTRHYPREYPAIAEIMPALRSNGVERPAPAVLDEDGVPVMAPPAPDGRFAP